jgi:magnesium chelatase family protein
MRLRPAWIEGIAEFRARDHTISGLISGRSPPHPGEVMLAHLGVLFLEESSEFQQTLSVPV